MPSRAPAGRLTHVAGVDRIALDPFSRAQPAADGRPRACRHQGRRRADGGRGAQPARGSFPWHLDYDEIEYVIEGELHITLGSQRVVGRPKAASSRSPEQLDHLRHPVVDEVPLRDLPRGLVGVSTMTQTTGPGRPRCDDGRGSSPRSWVLGTKARDAAGPGRRRPGDGIHRRRRARRARPAARRRRGVRRRRPRRCRHRLHRGGRPRPAAPGPGRAARLHPSPRRTGRTRPACLAATSGRSSVIESADLECTGLVDEPSAANEVLRLRDGVVVDVGGGTTGVAVVGARSSHRRRADRRHASDPRHRRGLCGIPVEEAERLKTDPAPWRLLPLVRPIIEVASIVVTSTAGWPVRWSISSAGRSRPACRGRQRGQRPACRRRPPALCHPARHRPGGRPTSPRHHRGTHRPKERPTMADTLELRAYRIDRMRPQYLLRRHRDPGRPAHRG